MAYRLIQCDSIPVPQIRQVTWRLSVNSSPEKPRWIIVGFQTGTSGDQEQNLAIFDQCNLTNMFVIQIKVQFSANVPANTEAYAVVISDISLIFQSDGKQGDNRI